MAMYFHVSRNMLVWNWTMVSNIFGNPWYIDRGIYE